MMDLGALGVTGISTIVAGAAAAASVTSFVRDLYKKFMKPETTPAVSAPDEGASVLVQTPDGRSKRVHVTLEEANSLLRR